MKFAKVMFLHLCVCPQGGEPGQVPPGRYTHQSGTPPGQVHPPSGAVQAGRYGQQAGGTHPNGMHSCYFLADEAASHVEVTTVDTSTGDYQIVDETTITRVTDPEPKYKIDLPLVPKNEAKSREYSHQGS